MTVLEKAARALNHNVQHASHQTIKQKNYSRIHSTGTYSYNNAIRWGSSVVSSYVEWSRGTSLLLLIHIRLHGYILSEYASLRVEPVVWSQTNH